MSRKRWFFSLLATFSLGVLGTLVLQTPAAKQGLAQAPPPAAAPAPAAAEAKPPEVPDYFKGENKDPAKPVWPDPTGGSAGVWATPAGDGKGDAPKALTPADLYDRITHNLFSVNVVWALITGFLVMFMQAGFALVETGLCRAKNAAHTMAMNFMIYPLGCLAFWVYGFAIGWGNWFNGPVPPGWYSSLGPGTAILNSGLSAGGYGIMGTKGFFLAGIEDVSVLALFFFMM